MNRHFTFALLLGCTALAGCQTLDRLGDWLSGDDQKQVETEKAGPETPAHAEKEGKEMESSPVSRPETSDPIIPPSTQSGIPDVEQRGLHKPFPQPFP